MLAQEVFKLQYFLAQWPLWKHTDWEHLSVVFGVYELFIYFCSLEEGWLICLVKYRLGFWVLF